MLTVSPVSPSYTWGRVFLATSSLDTIIVTRYAPYTGDGENTTEEASSSEMMIHASSSVPYPVAASSRSVQTMFSALADPALLNGFTVTSASDLITSAVVSRKYVTASSPLSCVSPLTNVSEITSASRLKMDTPTAPYWYTSLSSVVTFDTMRTFTESPVKTSSSRWTTLPGARSRNDVNVYSDPAFLW